MVFFCPLHFQCCLSCYLWQWALISTVDMEPSWHVQRLYMLCTNWAHRPTGRPLNDQCVLIQLGKGVAALSYTIS